MISFFPTIYADELLYSVCARFFDYVQYPKPLTVFEELLGNVEDIGTFIPLNCFEYLYKNLPHNHEYSVHRLVNQHSVIPFYRPFLALEQVELFYRYLERPKVKQVSRQFRVKNEHLRISEWLRFCPLCLAEEKEKLNEGYWHRLHQLPGVEICPVHFVFLQNSGLRTRDFDWQHPFKLVSANKIVRLEPLVSIEISNPCHMSLLRIAQDAFWLLNQSNLFLNANYLRDRYLHLLAEHGMLREGNIDRKLLEKSFASMFSKDLLSHIFLDDSINSGRRLTEIIKCSIANHHPVYHLLLIQLLGHTAESFFDRCKDEKPFGEGPWLCLNHAANHFGKPHITEHCVERFESKGRVRGIFYCSCGFVYSRTDSEIPAEEAICFNRIENFGSVWESELRELWSNPSLKILEIADRLGVSYDAVVAQAERLRLQIPRSRNT
jgi:Tn7-like transposition protein D/TniQ